MRSLARVSDVVGEHAIALTAAQVKTKNRRPASPAPSSAGAEIARNGPRAGAHGLHARGQSSLDRADWRRARRLAYAVFAIAWCFLAWPWLSGHVTIPYDAKALFQAQLQFLATSLHTGQSPFWNPYSFLGFPQVADPQSLIFTPAFVLAYLVKTPSFALLDWYVMLLVGAGGCAMLALCSDRGWHPAAALVAALTFAFGGAAAWRLQHIGQLQSYAFLAIILWCFLRALDRRSGAWAAGAGLAAGTMLAAPNQVALLGSYSLVVIYVAHIFQGSNPKQELAATVRLALVAGSVAIAIAAVPIALTYFFLQESNRPVIAFAEAARGSLHPASLLTFLIGDLFGALNPGVDYWGPYSPHWNKDELTLSQNMCQIYSGIVPALLLFVIGIIRRHLLDRQVRVYTALLMFGILYSLGAYTPTFRFLYDVLPGVRDFRRPADGTFLIAAMISIITGYLVHLWLTCRIRRVSDLVKALEFLAIGGLFALSFAIAVWQGKTDVAWQPMLLALLWTGAAGLLLQIPDSWARKGTFGMVIVLAFFVAADLRLNNAANASTGVSPSQIDGVLSAESSNRTIAYLKANTRREMGSQWRDRVELLGLGFDWQNAASVHRLENTLGYNPFRIGLVSRAIGARDYNVGVDQRTFVPLFPSYRSLLSDMLGLRYIASGAPLEEVDSRLRPDDVRLVMRTADAYIYENDRVLPRVLLVPQAMPADFDRILADGRWPDFDPRQTVLISPVHADLVSQFPASNPGAPAPTKGDRAVIARYDHARIDVKTMANGPRLLVINDVWHPWWNASVDGREARLVQANAIFRAVPVPAGEHIVTLEFNPMRGMFGDLRRRARKWRGAHAQGR